MRFEYCSSVLQRIIFNVEYVQRSTYAHAQSNLNLFDERVGLGSLICLLDIRNELDEGRWRTTLIFK